MTAPVATPAARTIAFGAGAAVVAALGCGALAARPALVGRSTPALALLFGVLLVAGISTPLVRPAPGGTAIAGVRSMRGFAIASVVGVVAFGAGRALIGGHAPASLTFGAIAANTLAAVAEEVWFRRLCYGLLAPAGPAFAVGASSVLFAVVHVSTYGFAILPLDLAAGALLGWQRAVTGSWTAPALTHALANLFVLL